ncbi:MAG: flavodoxin family protein [Candidatus Aminicenantes bacterium]|nr:flavodoxin family protein [Candidatus Aminicenantes bacterium]
MKKNIIILVVLALLFFRAGLDCANPKKILIVYYSATGHTKQLAEAVSAGAKSVIGVQVKLLPVKEAKAADALWADAVILGSPVYNANMAPAILEYINSWPFEDAPMRDKIGAAFVSAGGISAGEELTLMTILHSMLIYEMIVVGGRDWLSAFGASAIVEEEPFGKTAKTGQVAPYFLKKATGLGKRVAQITLRF